MSSQLSRREFLKLSASTGLASLMPDQSRSVFDEKRLKIPLTQRPVLNPPNVLLIVMDTVRSANMSLYGYTRPTTPNLERIAKHSALFEHAISNSPWTLPSHASMFTGYLPHQLSTNFYSPLDNTYPTLAETLREQGYLTAGFVGNSEFCSREFGLSRGFDIYRDFQLFPGQLILGPSILNKIASSSFLRDLIDNHQLVGRRFAEQINSEFVSWLSTMDGEKPFFVFLNYCDAHDPYLPPSDYLKRFSSSNFREKLDLRKKYSLEDTHNYMDAYDGAIAYLDQQVADLFSSLEKTGQLQHTIVIMLSDHGEQFGEHGVMGHHNNLYYSTLRVPLVIYYPDRVPAGIRIENNVSLRDIPNTIFDLLGITPRTKFPGISMRKEWEKNETGLEGNSTSILSEVRKGDNPPEWWPVSRGDMRSLVMNGYHYILYGDGQEELYDCIFDPREKSDISKYSQYQSILLNFRNEMKAAS